MVRAHTGHSDYLDGHMAPERAEAVRALSTRSWAAPVRRHPVMSAVVFYVAGLLMFHLLDLIHAPTGADPLIRAWGLFIVLLPAAVTLTVLLVALGWWRAAGFAGPRHWRAPHLLWLPALYLAWNHANVLLQRRSGTDPDWSWLAAGVPMSLIGFCEETLLRGLVLFPLLYAWRRKPHGVSLAVLTSSALFGLAHLGNLVAAPLSNTLNQIGYTFFIGVALAGLLLRTNTLWLGIIWHGLYNAALPLSQALGREPSSEAMSVGVVITGLVINLPLLIYGLYLIRHHAPDPSPAPTRPAWPSTRPIQPQPH
jgi:membrane protease YdiL (CAAX protease family)